MVDFLNEDRLTFGQLARQEGVNPSTVWRWTLRGVRGVKLEFFSVGGRRYTTREAFARFVEASTAVAMGESVPTVAVTNLQREAAVSAAERELAEAGV